jgi:hypothetical protein
MQRAATAAAICTATLVTACGGNEPPVTPSKALPRVDISSQPTDIGALPTVAPPPGLIDEKDTDSGGASTPTPSPASSPPPTSTPVATPTRTVPTNTPTPGVTFEPPDG